MQWVWGRDPHGITLPTTRWNYEIFDARVSGTQIIGVVFAIVVTTGTAVFLRVTKVGTAMRALANDREITATLGVPVRRVEAAAWLGSGLLCGGAGLLLSNLVGLDIVGLTFLVIPALAAALIGQLRSLWVTLAAGFLIGIVQSGLTAFSEVAEYRTLTPFVLAILALLWFAMRRQQTLVRSSWTTEAGGDDAVARRGRGDGPGRARSSTRSVAARIRFGCSSWRGWWPSSCSGCRRCSTGTGCRS